MLTMNQHGAAGDSQQTDAQRIQGVVATDVTDGQAAFAALYADHQPAFHRFCVTLVGQNHAEDLAQTVWQKIWQTLRSGRGEDYGNHFRSVLFQTARRTAIDQWRRNRQSAAETESMDELTDPAAVTAESHLMQREMEADRGTRLTQCLQELKQRFEKRYAVACLRIQATPVTDICHRLDLERGRVDRLWHDARHWLQECVNREAV
jgi:RNA polymerase sigma factor (sigma-70 family)